MESSLLAVLPDHLNAEIVAGTITSRKDALCTPFGIVEEEITLLSFFFTAAQSATDNLQKEIKVFEI